MKLKLFMPTTSIAGGLFMLKRTKKIRRLERRRIYASIDFRELAVAVVQRAPSLA